MAGYPVVQRKSIKDLALSEGQSITYYGFYVGTLNTGALNQGLGVGFYPNRAVYMDSIIISSNVPIYADLIVSGQSNTLAIPANGTLVVPVNTVYHPYEPVSTNFCVIKKLRAADGSDATASASAVVTCSVIGRTIYDDMNVLSDKTILFLGDSVFCGSGRTLKTECYDWKLRNYYSEKGINVRGSMHATSGKTSADYEILRQNGVFDNYQGIDLVVYELMINNAAQKPGGDPAYIANYVSDLGNMIAHKQRRWPGAKMIVLGCYPQQVTATENAAVLLRAAAAAKVTAVADPNVLYCDLGQLGTVFSSVNANYATSDGAGTGIHPSAQGDGYIWNGNSSFVGGLKGWLDANIPTI